MIVRRVLAFAVGLLLIAVGISLSIWIQYPGTCGTPSGYCVDPPLDRNVVSALFVAVGTVAGLWLIRRKS